MYALFIFVQIIWNFYQNSSIMQDENAGEIDGNQESKQDLFIPSSNTNENDVASETYLNEEHVMDIADEESPTLSPLRTRSTNCQSASNKSKRRVKTVSEKATLKKCAKRDTEINSEVPSNSETKCRKIMQKEECNEKENSIKCKKSRRKKVVFCSTLTESKPENVLPVSFREETPNQGDKKITSELSASLCQRQCHNEDQKKRNMRKMCGNVSTRQAGSLRLKKQKLDCIDMNMIEETCKVQNPVENDESSSKVDGKYISYIKQKQQKHGTEVNSVLGSESNKELRSMKKMKVSFYGISEDGLMNDQQEGHSNISPKETQFTEKATYVSAKETKSNKKVRGSLGSRIPDNLETLGIPVQANGAALHTCQTLARKVQCAFCLSSEDSEVSVTRFQVTVSIFFYPYFPFLGLTPLLNMQTK